jgi:aldehyde dehydrogenase (NAD+)
MSQVRKIYDSQVANRWRIAQTTAEQRVAKLKMLRQAIYGRSAELQKAIYSDFQKNPAEVDLTETHVVLAELNTAIEHLSKWMRPQRVRTPLVLFGTRSEILYEPKGVVLILSPWNYPFQLAVSPLTAAVAAGNCVMLKPSEKTRNTARFLRELVSSVFAPNEVAVIEGDHTVADTLLELPFDHIFFTGSPAIGKKIMGAAAKHLTHVTLELGGKSPVIVDETADVKKAAQRIVWGKFINAGQSCVAPDYVVIHESLVESFIRHAKIVIAERYGADITAQTENPDYCRLISDEHQTKLLKLLEDSISGGAKVELGGTGNLSRFIPPTLLTVVNDGNPIMNDEIFGPILPILTYRTLDSALDMVRKRHPPLALYIFSNNHRNIDRILKSTTAGGTCVNSLMIHLANPNLPFGGVGMSGMGNYHGFFGFKTFSHERAVLKQGHIDVLRALYPPYTPFRKKLIEFLMKHLA